MLCVVDCVKFTKWCSEEGFGTGPKDWWEREGMVIGDFTDEQKLFRLTNKIVLAFDLMCILIRSRSYIAVVKCNIQSKS